MWVAVHAYVTFKASGADRGNRVLLEESVVLMEVETHQDVYDRLGELKEMLGPGSCVYPGYESTGGLGIRKVVSVLNLDDDNAMPPSDKSELTYELYEFADDAAAGEFIEGKRVHAKMQKKSWKADFRPLPLHRCPPVSLFGEAARFSVPACSRPRLARRAGQAWPQATAGGGAKRA